MATTRKIRRERDKATTKENAKRQRKEIIEKLAIELIDYQKGQKNWKESYGQFAQKIREAQVNMPWLTIDQVKSKATRIKKKKSPAPPQEENQTSTDNEVLLGGRPRGTTKAARKATEEKKLEAKILITSRLKKSQDAAKKKETQVFPMELSKRSTIPSWSSWV